MNDFERIWFEYPRRYGNQGNKKLCQKMYDKAVEKYSFDSVLIAVRNYSAECEMLGLTGTEYVKQLNTWLLVGRAKGQEKKDRLKNAKGNKKIGFFHGIEDYL